MATTMLTTRDNPFNPFTQFDEWYRYDEFYGHHSCGMLARFAFTSDELTEEENDEIINEAIDEICNFDGNFIKVTEESFKNRDQTPSS